MEKVKRVQGHIAVNWQGQGLDPGLSGHKFMLLTSMKEFAYGKRNLFYLDRIIGRDNSSAFSFQ